MNISNKTFFIVPGFRTQVNSADYKWLISFLEKRGMKVVKVPVSWNRTVVSKNAIDFVSFFNKHKNKENFILGFSFGAVITLLTANTLKPNKIFLCSLSPAFNEDLAPNNLEIVHYIGKRRFSDFKTFDATKLAKNLKIPSTIFYGEKEAREYPKLKNRCEETARLAKKSKLIVVKGAPHKINFPAYQEAIMETIK